MLDSLKNKKIIAVLGVLLCLAMCGVFGGLCMADVQGTVYISDSGSDMSSGADASHPVKTLGTAYKKLSGGGTLIVEGKLSVKGELPSSDGKVTVKGSTSSSQLVLLGDIRLNSDTAFESITINGSSGAFHIMCAGHNVTFGDGIVTTKGSAYPAIIGGIVMTDGMNAEEATFSNYKIEINSGTYNYVYGSNRRTSDKQPMGVTGDVSLVINGGSFVGTGHTADDTAVCAVGSYASQNGAYYMEINGGTFNCGVFGIARPGINANTLVAYYRGDLHMKITGGSFKGTCMGAVQNTLASYVGGNFLFEVTGGSFTSTLEHISGEGVRGRCTYAVTEQLLPFMYAFERTVFVSNAGNDKYSGATNDTAVATIARAAELLGKRGGTVVVCSRVTVPKNFTFPDYTDGIVITSKLGERDHTDTAQLTFNTKTTFLSDAEIRDISILGRGESTELCFYRNASVCDGVSSSANSINIKCEDTADDRTLRLGGCDFGSISGGSARNSDVFLVSGSAQSICASKSVSGDVYLKLGECSVSGKITLCEGDAGGDCAIEIAGASLTDGVISFSGGKVSGTVGAHIYSIASDSKVSFTDLGTDKGVYINKTQANIDFGSMSELTSYIYVSESDKLRDAIVELSKADGGTVVISSGLEINELTALPADGSVLICSRFGGIDYRRISGAELGISGNMNLFSPVVFDNINIVAKALHTEICANSYQLTFGYGVHCYTDQDMGIETYPDIVSGARITKSTLKLFTQKPASVTVNGGTWNSVTFGSVRAEGGRATLHTVKGDGKISIGGGTFRGIVKLSGMSSMEGSLSAEISGGSFLCPVYVIASPVTVDSDVSSIIGDISLKITGGDFHSDIDFAQNDNRNTFNGKYTLTIEGGDLRCVGEIIGADGIEGENSSTLRVSESFNYDGKSEGTVKFKNPVVIGAADPSIYCYNGYYYYTKAGYYNGKPAVISSRAANLSDIGCAVEYVLWYEDGEEKINSLWAPQLYFLDGQAYIYASCAVDGSTRRFPYVWKCTNPNNILDGKAEMLGRVGKYDKQMDSWLSPRLMEYKGQLYYISAVFASASDRVSTNYKERMIIAKMESPISFAEEKVHIIANPDKAWERFDIMEGAFALTAPDGTLYISYAANYTDKNDYCTGVLELVGDNLLSPSSWKKHELPIQEREPGSGIYGPGATVYINAPDGETWAAYHIKTHADNKYACRHIVLQKLEWENGHTPVLGYPDGLWEIHEMEVNPMSVAERVQGFGTFERIAATGIPEENSGGFRVNVAALIITAGIAAALGACICVMLCIPKKKKEKEN